MSHEQNMHHHLIYLANAKHITSSHYTLHSVLTNMQMIETQYMSLAPANRPQAPFNSVASVVSASNTYIIYPSAT